MQPSDASWGSAFPTMAYQVWMTTGSTAVITKHLAALVKYIDSLAIRLQHSGMAKNSLGHCESTRFPLRHIAGMSALQQNERSSLTWLCAALLACVMQPDGDWFPPSNGQKGSTDLVSAATFIQDTRHVAAMAGAVGDTKTQTRLLALEGSLAKQFNAAFGVPTNAFHRNLSDMQRQPDAEVRIGNGCQTDIGTALWLGTVPQSSRRAMIEALVKDIQAHDYHITSGILGTRSVYEALAMNGRMDVALKMLVRAHLPHS